MSFSVDDKIKFLCRELALRKNVYPKWVDAGRITQEYADREIAVMQEIHDDFIALARLGDRGRPHCARTSSSQKSQDHRGLYAAVGSRAVEGRARGAFWPCVRAA